MTLDSFSGVLLLLLEICTPALLAIIAWAVRHLAKKWHIDSVYNVDTLVNDIVRRAVLGVEKINESLKKRQERALESSEKLAMALNTIEGELRALKLPEISKELLRMRVEAYLKTIDKYDGLNIVLEDDSEDEDA